MLDPEARGRKQLGRFVLREQLGSGSMGTVWSAYDPLNRRQVALKRLHLAERTAVELLKQEFRVAAELAHPNLVGMYELFVDETSCYFTMDLVHGLDLERWRQARTPSLQQLVELHEQIATGLSALHYAGILHLDIKPQNIIVRPDGVPVILDFGLARARLPRTAEGGGGMIGTLAYMAPEMIFGNAPSPACDWYSFASVLYECITDSLPFTGSAAHIAQQKLEQRPPRLEFPTELGAPLCRAITGLLDPEADQRDRHISQFNGQQQEPGRPLPVELVGREQDLARLHGYFERCRSGGLRSVCVLSGAPGIGKSSLAHHFLAQLGERVCVIAGRCFERESIPYKGLDALLDVVTTEAPRDHTQLDETNSHLYTLFGEGQTRAHAGHVERRTEAFREIARRLEAHCDQRALVLFLDDIQWADDDGARLILSLLSHRGFSSLFVVCTQRSNEASPLRELLQLNGAELEEQALSPLELSDAVELIRQLAGVETDEAVKLARDTRGSPLLIELVSRHGGQRDADLSRDLGAIIGALLDTLAPKQRQLLELLAIAGRPISRRLVEHTLADQARGLFPLTSLRNLGLVGNAGLHPEDSLTCHHDRIREVVSASLPPTEQRALHLSLARSLERQVLAQPHHLALHYFAGGATAQAGHYAELAAHRAVEALAFSRAAEQFGLAASCNDERPELQRRLLRRQAETLVLAGRGALAADIYIELAKHAESPPAKRGLLRLASEQLLSTGHQQRGLEILRPLLAEADIAWPRSSSLVVIRMLTRLLGLRLRGLALPSTTNESERARGELCWSAARGLLATDSTRGAYYIVESLVHARRSGDELLTLRAATIVGSVILSPAGGPFARWGAALLATARARNREPESDHLHGLQDVCEGNQRILEARWPEALELCEQGLQRLRGLAADTSWEQNLGEMGALRALEELGRLHEAARRAKQLVARHSELGDLHGLVTALLFAGQLHLTRGELAASQRAGERAANLWSAPTYTMQDLYLLRLRVLGQLFEGQRARALEELRAGWEPLQGSGLLRLPPIFLDAQRLRAQVMLANGERQEARVAIRALTRAPSPVASARGSLLACELEDRPEARVRLATRAELVFERHAMAADALAARWQRARAQSDASQQHRCERALEELGIAEPQRWLQLQLPAVGSGR